MERQEKINYLVVAVFGIAMMAFSLWLDSQPWAHNLPEGNGTQEWVGFVCVRHNYTTEIMEPQTRYICFENQTCYAFTDGAGGGLFMWLTECIESHAFRGNSTIRCNGTVEDCERTYNLRGNEL